MDNAAAIAAAAAAFPVDVPAPSTPVVRGRVLLVDGDFLAYNQAGGDDTEPGQARRYCLNRIEMMREAAGCESVVVHLTASGSHKGLRYAIATVKPYQAKRSGSRPKNWAFLREWLETYSGPAFRTKIWTQREADDGMAYHATLLGKENAVIATKDKDLRMVPAFHISWELLTITAVHGAYRVVGVDQLLYGHAWFWQQLLEGDKVDNIPGLPYYVPAGSKPKLIGEKTAEKFLSGATNDAEALKIVSALYASFYKDEWAERLAEQMLLLWIRRDEQAELDDVASWIKLSPEVVSAISAHRGRVAAMQEEVNGRE